jgi:hypothetical protein
MGKRGIKPAYSGTSEGGWVSWPSEQRDEIEKAIGLSLTDDAWRAIDEAMILFQSCLHPNTSPLVTKKNDANTYANVRKRMEKRVAKASELIAEQISERSANEAVSENWAFKTLGYGSKSEIERRLRTIQRELLELSAIIRDGDVLGIREPSEAEAKVKAIQGIAAAVSGEMDIDVAKNRRPNLSAFETLIRELGIHPIQSDDAWCEYVWRAVKL